MLQCFSCIWAVLVFCCSLFHDFLGKTLFPQLQKTLILAVGLLPTYSWNLLLPFYAQLVQSQSWIPTPLSRPPPWLVYFTFPSSSNLHFDSLNLLSSLSSFLAVGLSLCLSGHGWGLLLSFFLLHNTCTLELLCNAIVLPFKRSSALLLYSTLEPVWCFLQGLWMFSCVLQDSSNRPVQYRYGYICIPPVDQSWWCGN